MVKSILKSESHKNTVPKTTIRTEVGQPRIITTNRYIDDQRKSDLRMPTRLITYDNMYSDDSVYTPIDIRNLLVVTSLYGGEYVPGPSKSSISKTSADFLNYSIRNMSYGTYLEFLRDATTDLRYGFSIQNIVTEKRNYGPYKGSYVLKKLSPRDQKSIYGWLWNKDQTELLGAVQQPRLKESKNFKPTTSFKNGLFALNPGKFYESDYPIIKTNQMLHFKFNSTNNNPQGDSPLSHCYNAWMELKLISEYSIIGISKDLGGIVVLRVPSQLIEKANDPTNYPEAAAEYAALQQNTADLHAGKSSFILLTSDSDDITKKYFYDFELKGITGSSGKQYDTTKIIDQRKKSIYNTFGAGFLLLGEDNVGSYALSSDKSTTFSYYVDSDVLQKVDVLNNQLAPRLLAVNDVYLSYKDMPIYKPADPTQVDYETISKAIMRIGSGLNLTQSALEHFYNLMGIPLDGIEELDFTDRGESRVGDSQGSSGVGESQAGGGASSTANGENSDVTKNFIQDGDHIIDSETGDLADII